jgi:hypothetical protein
MKKRRLTTNEPAFKIATLQVAGAMRSGVQFVGRQRNGRADLYFWQPSTDADLLARWLGHDWEILDSRKLMAETRRSRLLKFWLSRPGASVEG